jgi:hypothetical protein
VLGSLLDAAGDRMPVAHSVTRLRAGGSGEYRIEAVFNPVRYRFKEAICDGQRLWKVYDDKVTEGPAKPPPAEIGALVDASWLLDHHLTGGTETMADGRRGYLLGVGRNNRPWGRIFQPDLVVVDAELGIVLRWMSRRGSRTTVRYELRNVVAGAAEPGAFWRDVPADLPVVEEDPDADDISALADPARLASAIAEQAAKGARSAVQSILDIIRRP